MRGEVEEGESDGREKKYAHLLQPIRNLAENWNVDIAHELEEYLAELETVRITVEGGAVLNFAEAALLIQGSACIYGKKVEYLYSLVLQTLGSISQERKEQPQSTAEKEVPSEGHEAEEEDEVDQFLNLDDVSECSDIDLDETDGDAPSKGPERSKKTPSILLTVEENIQGLRCPPGIDPELASYKIFSCTMHCSGALLLEAGDGDFLDEFLQPIDQTDEPNMRNTSFGSPSPDFGNLEPRDVPARTPGTFRGMQSVEKRRQSVHNGTGTEFEHVANAENLFEKFDEFGGNEDSQMNEAAEEEEEVGVGATAGVGEGEGREAEGEGEGGRAEAEKHGPAGRPRREKAKEKNGKYDPYAPLDPHDGGNIPLRPFKKGRHRRRVTSASSRQDGEFPLASLTGVSNPEFGAGWEAEKARAYRRSMEGEERLRSGGQTQSAFEAEASHCEVPEAEEGGTWNEYGANDLDGDVADLDTHSDMPQVGAHDCDNLFSNADFPNVSAREASATPAESAYGDLCRAHIDAAFHEAAKAKSQTELALRVAAWKSRIGPALEEQEARPPFDIHVYGERVFEGLLEPAPYGRNLPEGVAAEKSFTELAGGQPRHEVSRMFAAMLQLINNGNVSIERPAVRPMEPLPCFTAKQPFHVQLRCTRRRHEELANNFAPFTGAGTERCDDSLRHETAPLPRRTPILSG